MPARALLVLLVMLNFGVATWWALRPGPNPPPPWTPPAGVPRLQLLQEAAADPLPRALETEEGGVAPAGADDPSVAAAVAVADARDAGAAPEAGSAPAVAPPARPSGAGALRCLAFGPFDSAADIAAARAALQPLGASRMRARDVVEAPAGWRVMLPPQPDRAAADALAGQIRRAGFDDLLVVPSGAEANGIALGLYGSERAARRREAALRAAGFPVQALPVGEAVTRHWLDVAAGAGFDAAAARSAASAARVQDIDCSGIVDAGGAR